MTKPIIMVCGATGPMTSLGMADDRGEVQGASHGSRSERMVCAAAASLFVASAAATIVWCLSMSDMVVPMPGGGTLSMMWQPMCGRTWVRTASSFLGMWMVMMVAMMLPSLMPMLQHYVRAIEGTEGIYPALLTAIAGVGYFCLWAVVGVVVFLTGAVLAALAIETPALARGVPMLMGCLVVGAGALQFTAWKARHLVCCRAAPPRGPVLSPDAITAWRHGLGLGVECARCCSNLMVILFVLGTMNLSAMTVVTVAITAERIAPAGERVTYSIGVVAVTLGLVLIAHAL